MEKYIQPFISTCEKVFSEFCNTKVKANRIFFTTKDEFEGEWDISGVIGLSGQVTGAVAISIKESTAKKIANILTGKSYERMEADVTDAVGEIVNIIAGNVKKNFEDELRIKISLPSIIKGKAHMIIWPTEKTRIISVPFEIFKDEKFCLSVAIDPSK